jgi:catechol 2,3-dioxygenase-like lactoylglutathione lyase family enzyme
MQINHINLSVTSVVQARHFFETYFGLHCPEQTSESAKFIALYDENGFVLTLMESKEPTTPYPSTFHIGFLNQGKERTQAIYEQLSEEGYDMKPPGYYRPNEHDLYIPTPFGITVQVS